MEKIEEVREGGIGKNKGNFNVQNDAKFSLKSFFHTWTLSNFSKCLNFTDASVYSPVFEFENATWRFCMHAISEGEDHQLKEIKIRPCKVNKNGINHYLRYNISICDDNMVPLTTKTAESRLESENFARRLTFSIDGDEKEALKSVLENDKLIFHCEFLVLSAIPCEEKSVKQAPSTNPVNKNVKQWMHYTPKKTLPGNSKYKVVNHVDDWKRKDTERFFVCFLLMMAVSIMMFYAVNETNKLQAKQINELIIDTTLKVYDIADAFNFTEIKIKSLELLSSYHKLYDVSDSSKVDPDKYFKAISSKLKKDISA